MWNLVYLLIPLPPPKNCQYSVLHVGGYTSFITQQMMNDKKFCATFKDHFVEKKLNLTRKITYYPSEVFKCDLKTGELPKDFECIESYFSVKSIKKKSC